ncbi:Helix-turn-helix domain-containing protein, partial [Streptomyces sp. IgraMP-1]
ANAPFDPPVPGRTTGDRAPPSSAGRARLLAAVPLLRERSVTEVSGRAGYASPAAFTAAFTRSFGTPPSRFAGPAPRA